MIETNNKQMLDVIVVNIFQFVLSVVNCLKLGNNLTKTMFCGKKTVQELCIHQHY